MALAVVLASCSTPQKQMQKVEDVKYGCDPEVLTVVNDKVEGSLQLTFPKGYFDKRSLMVFTPVIVYQGGQSTGQPFIYQGESVMANYKVVPVSGITHQESFSFAFVPAMEKCTLELRMTLVNGDKRFELKPVKLANGTNVTYRMAQISGEYEFRPDGYERITKHSTETSILFDVNSSTVKNSSRNRSAVNVYKSYLSDLNVNERYKVTGTEIVAYASPEGGEEYNAKLSDRRADAAVRTWNDMSSDMKADTIAVRSMGQDWDGFKEALENSDIEEKDLILRVLSMYSDPAIRESEIRNLSFIYDDLKKEVFPDLRRATFVVNAEHTGYSDEELIELSEKYLSTLSEPEVLHLATITEDPKLRKYYYRFAGQRFLSETGYYNLALMSLDENSNEIALVYLDKAGEDADVLNARGVVEMRKGRYADARTYFLRAGGNRSARENLGTLCIIEGKYDEAAELLAGSGSANEVLAYILTNQIDKAVSAARTDTPRDAYIAAVAYARHGDDRKVEEALEIAKSDPVLAEKMQKDVEFVEFR